MYDNKPIQGTLVNREHPLANGLVAAYLFNEGSGPPIDALGAGAPLALGSAVTWGNGPDAIAGPGLVFPGVSGATGYALGALAGGLTTSKPLSIWALISGPQNGGNLLTVHTAGSYPGIAFCPSTTGSGKIADNASGSPMLALPQLSASIASQILFSQPSSSGNSVYVNGTLAASGAYNVPATLNSTWLGSNPYGSGSSPCANGAKVHGLLIWNVGLTAGQAQSLEQDPDALFRRPSSILRLYNSSASTFPIAATPSAATSGAVALGLSGAVASAPSAATSGAATPGLSGAMKATPSAATSGAASLSGSLALAAAPSAGTGCTVALASSGFAVTCSAATGAAISPGLIGGLAAAAAAATATTITLAGQSPALSRLPDPARTTLVRLVGAGLDIDPNLAKIARL